MREGEEDVETDERRGADTKDMDKMYGDESEAPANKPGILSKAVDSVLADEATAPTRKSSTLVLDEVSVELIVSKSFFN